MPQPMRSRVNEFIADVFRLSAGLDSVSRRDNAERVAAIVRSAREAYELLLQRQHALKLPADDAEMIQAMLERIRARLRFLS